MLRRFSSKFGGKNKKDEVNGSNGTSSKVINGATNGTSSETNEVFDTIGVANGASEDKPASDNHEPSHAPIIADKKHENHAASRGDVESSFEQFAQLLHASRRPLPTQSGDGAYLDHTEPSGLMADIKKMGFKDAKTLMSVMRTKVTGELQDDKTYLMEHTIQVSRPKARPYVILIRLTVGRQFTYEVKNQS